MQDILLTEPAQQHAYHIFVGTGLLQQSADLLKADQYSNVFVVTDEHTEQLLLPKLQQALQVHAHTSLPAGEQTKNIDTVQRIWRAMIEADCDRDSLVIILGGGVTGDMGAFAASTYMRGIAYAHIPTTLLAQVDSSIGGKTGFDFDEIKNLVGTISPPVAVLIDTETLSSLPRRELVAGFAEMLKHGLIKDAAYFDALAQKPPQDYSPTELADLIAASIRIKTAIVESDEKEAGGRKIVNFGHTVGHAIEALSWETDHPLLHGEAIAIGMVIESELSRQKGFISDEDIQHIKHVFEGAGLPTISPHCQLEALWQKMRHDKKNEHGIVLFDLLERVGKAVYNQTVDDKVVSQVISQNMEL